MLLITRKLILDAAGQAEDRQGGSLLILKALSAGGTIDVTWLDSAYGNAGTAEGVGIGDELHAGGQFGGYRVKGAAGATVTLYVGPASARVSSTLQAALTIGHVISDAGSVVTVDNIPANPVPVKEAQGAALTDNAAVAVNNVLTAVLAAAPRISVRIINQGDDDVAIGGAGLTWAKRAIVLKKNDMWIEDRAPSAAIKAICDAGKTATLGVQEV